MYVKITVLKERLANLERLGEYFVSREVGGDLEEMFCWAMHEWTLGLLKTRHTQREC